MSSNARILLVVTGDLEEVALAAALRRLFPSTYFGTTRTSGFTSRRLLMPAPGFQDSKAEDLVDNLLGAAIHPERGVPAYDYAVAFEDVELHNETEEAESAARAPDEGIQCILEHVKLAVDAVLKRKNDEQSTIVAPKGKAKWAPSIATDEDRRWFLRERCSFHLLRPMAEALFFGEPAALQRAAGNGVKLPPVHFDPSVRDIEAFQTDDPTYLAKPHGEAPWAKVNRRRHPKHYLSYLLDPTGSVLRPYRETKHGKRALEQLDWHTIVAPSGHARMVRALVDDIADMLEVALPWCAGPRHPATQRVRGGRLRNLL
jgi:hypothetical protein